jgi:hypothetical protein
MSRNWNLKFALAAVVAVPFFLFAQACGPECVDKYDCAAKAKSGEALTCNTSGKCVAGSPNVPLADAGTADAGS